MYYLALMSLLDGLLYITQWFTIYYYALMVYYILLCINEWCSFPGMAGGGVEENPAPAVVEGGGSVPF